MLDGRSISGAADAAVGLGTRAGAAASTLFAVGLIGDDLCDDRHRAGPDLMGSFTVGPSGRGAYAIIIITTNTTTFVVVLCVVALAVTSFVG